MATQTIKASVHHNQNPFDADHCGTSLSDPNPEILTRHRPFTHHTNGMRILTTVHFASTKPDESRTRSCACATGSYLLFRRRYG